MYRLSQASMDIVVQPIPMMLKDGTQATSLDVGSFTTGVIKPDGTLVSNYTEPAITNPNSDGVYSAKFETSANSWALIEINQGNPYAMTLNHPETDVEPMTVPVWVSDRLFGDVALNSTVNSIYTVVVADEATVVELTSDDANKTPRIEINDTYQFEQNFVTVPTSVGFSVIDPVGTVVISDQLATQSGATANFYYKYTVTNSFYTTVNSNGWHTVEWTAYRANGKDDKVTRYFEVIKTD